ncbi:MAG: hypothetical protein Q8O87_01245 [bacterium]|nr:hypothetical protein [bacterium]
MTNWLKQNWFKIGMIVAVLLAAYIISIAVYLIDPQSVSGKNQKCANGVSRIQREMRKTATPTWNEQLQEIFYSPDYGTCLYVSDVDNRTNYGISWRILKRLVDYRSGIPGSPLESCQYPVESLMVIAETRAIEMNNEDVLNLIAEDRSKPYEMWCGSFEAELYRLKYH